MGYNMVQLKLDTTTCHKRKMDLSHKRSSKINTDIHNLLFQTQNGMSTQMNSNGDVSPLLSRRDANKNLLRCTKHGKSQRPATPLLDEDTLNKFVTSTIDSHSHNGIDTLFRQNTNESTDLDFSKNLQNIPNIPLGSIKDFNRINSSPTNSLKSLINNDRSMLSISGSVGSSSTPSSNFDILGNDITATDYSNMFQNSEESITMLKRVFKVEEGSDSPPLDEILASLNTANRSKSPKSTFNTDVNFFEWLPNEPVHDSAILSNTEEILELFKTTVSSKNEEYAEEFLVSYQHLVPDELITKINNLAFVHETLYASSDVSTLSTLEKFLVHLLQPKNFYGELTPFGRLLAFINLSYIQKHHTQLTELYNHPEMSAIRCALNDKANGDISLVLNKPSSVTNDNATNFGMLPKFTNAEMPTFAQAVNQINSITTNSAKPKSTTVNVKQQKQRLALLDSLSKMYQPGGEPHFPRFVCGSIDRKYVKSSETISIPFEKSDRRNIHVQFEKFEPDDAKNMWPNGRILPNSIGEGTLVQVAPLKNTTHMFWKEGVISSITSGQVMITITSDPKPLKEKMYILRNFLPPNVPLVRMEKGYWRLMPREINLDTDIYVGSCLSLVDAAEGITSDVVVMNVYYNDERTLSAMVKSPSDESLFGVSDEYVDVGTCSCSGHTLRVFEGKSLGSRVSHVLVHYLHEKRNRVLDVYMLVGYKLNYDIQSHFDGVYGAVPQFANSLWVIPRNIDSLGIEAMPSERTGHSWLFTPDYCLIMFPFSRGFDAIQDMCRLIPFLHPELNYTATCAGLWILRTSKRETCQINEVPIVPEIATNVSDAISCTRSQKAAIRELTTDDVVSEVCSDLVPSPFPLIRRLFGCYPVVSLWIALDSYDPSKVEYPEIPTSVDIPKLELCSSCGGKIISHENMTKYIAVNGDVKQLPVFMNLERTEDIVQRMQHIAVCRWRNTREFIASYSVDDEISVTPKSPTISSIKHSHSNQEFLDKLTTLMSSVKRSRDTQIDPKLISDARTLTSEILTSNVESALLRGWSSFLSEQNKENEQTLKKDDKSCAHNLSKGSEELRNVSKKRCTARVDTPCDYVKQVSDFNHVQKANLSKMAPETSDAYIKNLKLLSKLKAIREPESQTSKDPVADNNDYCDFNDKPIRINYINKIIWDEDMEFERIIPHKHP